MSQTVPPQECKVLLSKKFGPKLIHRGYIYTVHKQRPNCVRWRCTQRNIQCRGSMTTDAVHYQTSAKLLMPHNHAPDREAVAATVAKSLQGFLETTEEDPEQSSAIHRLENLGTAVKVKSNLSVGDDEQEEEEEMEADLEDMSEDDDRLFGQQVDTDTNWKPHQGKGSTQKPSPVKVSKRIMEKNQIRLSRKMEPLRPKNRVSTSSSRSSDAPTPLIGDDLGGDDSFVDQEEVCLRWNSHYNNLQAAFPTILAREQYVDVTLCSEGQSIRCHKLVLSACSPYFEELIAGMSPWQHPVVYLKGTPFWVLKSLVDFMYVGEVGIEQSRLAQVLEVGAELKIKGLVKPSTQPSPPTFSYLQMPAKTPNSRPPTTMATKYPGPPVLRPNVPNPPVLTPTVKKPLETPPSLVSVLKVKAEKVEETPPPPKPTKPPPAKKTPKRRLSDTENPPLPEHLLFMRKGTRSRPLVKIPKIFDPESYTKASAEKPINHHHHTSRESPERRDSRNTSSTTIHISPVKLAEASTSLNMSGVNIVDDGLGLIQIKQEPIDIGETDVSYGNFLNEGHVLRFDEDEPGDEDDVDGVLGDDDLNMEEGDEQEFMNIIPSTIDKEASKGTADDVLNNVVALAQNKIIIHE